MRVLVGAGLMLALLGPGFFAGPLRAEEVADPARERARELSWTGDYGTSLRLYERLRAEAPGDLDLLREIGLVQLWAGRELDAIESLNAVVADRPADAEARLSLGRAHFYLGDARGAVAHYVFALPSFADDEAVVAEAVQVFRAAERGREAEAWLRYGLSRFPDSSALRLVGVREALARGDLDEADTAVRAILADHPDDAEAAALAAEVEADRRSPVRLADRLGHAGHYRKARRLLRSHLRVHGDDAGATRLLARFSAWNADYGDAQRLYRRLLEDDPDDRETRTELAEVTTWRGEYAPARTQLEALIAEDPSDARPQLSLANLHAWSGNHRRADALYRTILDDHPGHEGAAKQLRHLDQQRAPSGEPGFHYFRDNGGFSLWTEVNELRVSTRPGRTWSLQLDFPRAEGRITTGFDALTGEPQTRRETVQGYGVRVGFSERPDERWQYDAELGAASYADAGLAGRARLAVSRWLGYRNVVQLELAHGDALPEVRTIESGLEGVERSTAYLVHMYGGERLETWSRIEAGRYSDGGQFWTARTVVGLSLLARPFELELLGLGSVGDHDRVSPLYYSPQDLLTYAVGLRLKKRIFDRADLVLIGEYGRIHSDGGQGVTWRIGPEVNWELSDTLRLYLRYDHYQSLRQGSTYASDFVQIGLRYRLPVEP